MKISTVSTVTITMTGVEAHKLAVWLHNMGAANSNGPQCDLLLELRELPDETGGQG